MAQTPDRPVFEQFAKNPETFTASYICPGPPSGAPHEFRAIVAPLGTCVLPPTAVCPEHNRVGILADPNLLPQS